MAHRFRGVAVFESTALRDEYFTRWEDDIQGVLDVVPYPDNTPSPNTLPDGLAKWGTYVGTDHTGPAFSVSLKIPDEEFNDPPQGNGRCAALANAIDDRDDAEFGWSGGPIT
jgi:hypothetical protein